MEYHVIVLKTLLVNVYHEINTMYLKKGVKSYLDITNRTEGRSLQVANDTGLAEGMQAFYNGGGVHKVAGAQDTHQVGVELRQLHAA